MSEEYEEGFYFLINSEEPEPVLVHGYHRTDMGGAFVFGFNAHDGGGLLPLSDLRSGSTVIPVCAQEARKAEQLEVECKRLSSLVCETCNGYGMVGNILTAEDCSDCLLRNNHEDAIIENAHMSGQASVGVDPSYSLAREYGNKTTIKCL